MGVDVINQNYGRKKRFKGRRETEVSSGHPGRATHFVFGILEKTNNIPGWL